MGRHDQKYALITVISTRLLFKLFSELNCKLELLQKDKDQAVEDLQAARQQLGEINEEVSLKSEIVYFII